MPDIKLNFDKLISGLDAEKKVENTTNDIKLTVEENSLSTSVAFAVQEKENTDVKLDLDSIGDVKLVLDSEEVKLKRVLILDDSIKLVTRKNIAPGETLIGKRVHGIGKSRFNIELYTQNGDLVAVMWQDAIQSTARLMDAGKKITFMAKKAEGFPEGPSPSTDLNSFRVEVYMEIEETEDEQNADSEKQTQRS